MSTPDERLARPPAGDEPAQRRDSDPRLNSKAVNSARESRRAMSFNDAQFGERVRGKAVVTPREHRAAVQEWLVATTPDADQFTECPGRPQKPDAPSFRCRDRERNVQASPAARAATTRLKEHHAAMNTEKPQEPRPRRI